MSLILAVLAVVLFAVASYLSGDISQKLIAAGLALVAFLLLIGKSLGI